MVNATSEKEALPVPAITGFSHIALTVSDLDRSLDWYARAFGVNAIFRGRDDSSGFEVVYLQEPQSGILFGLQRHDGSAPSTFRPQVVGLDHLSFAVPARESLAEWATHFDASGIANGGVKDEPLGAGLTLSDPDGIALELYWLK